jgi:hypothetical protein
VAASKNPEFDASLKMMNVEVTAGTVTRSGCFRLAGGRLPRPIVRAGAF